MSKKDPKDVIQSQSKQTESEVEEHRRAFLKRIAALGVGVGMMGLEVSPLFAQAQRRERVSRPRPITIRELQLGLRRLTPKERERLLSLKVVPSDPASDPAAGGCDPKCKQCAAWKVFGPVIAE